MHGILMRRPDGVLVLMAGYFSLMFIVRLLMPDGLRFDEAQQAFFSQWILAGYDSQPPLYNWIQSAYVSVFGLSLASIAIVKAAALIGLYASYYRLAREVLTDKLYAVVATLSLMTIPQIFWEAQRDLTHSVALVTCINVFLLFVIKTLKSPTAGLYVCLGLFAGLGMISKYNFALLLLGAFVAVAADVDGRRRLFDPRILLSAAIGFLVVLPHGLWLIDNMAAASSKTLTIMGQEAPDGTLRKILQGPLRFIRITLLILAPPLLVYVLVFRRKLGESLHRTTRWSRFFDWIFLTIILAILVLILTIGMTSLRDRWLMPFAALVPIWLCLKLEANSVPIRDYIARFLAFPLVVMALMPIALLMRTNAPQFFGSYQAYNMPYGDFVERVLAEEGKTPALVQTTNWMVAGNSHLQMPDIPTMTTALDYLALPYDWSAERPILLIWLGNEGDAVPASMTAWLAEHEPEHRLGPTRMMDMPYQLSFNAAKARFGYAWVYPQAD